MLIVTLGAWAALPLPPLASSLWQTGVFFLNAVEIAPSWFVTTVSSALLGCLGSRQQICRTGQGRASLGSQGHGKALMGAEVCAFPLQKHPE